MKGSPRAVLAFDFGRSSFVVVVLSEICLIALAARGVRSSVIQTGTWSMALVLFL